MGPFLPGHLFVHFLAQGSLLEGPHLYLAVAVISLFVVLFVRLLVPALLLEGPHLYLAVEIISLFVICSLFFVVYCLLFVVVVFV